MRDVLLHAFANNQPPIVLFSPHRPLSSYCISLPLPPSPKGLHFEADIPAVALPPPPPPPPLPPPPRDVRSRALASGEGCSEPCETAAAAAAA
jgi:hypothetical protein